MTPNIVKQIIDNSFKNKKISHSFLVSSEMGPMSAEYLISRLIDFKGKIENHSDVFTIDSKDSLISKETIISYLQELSHFSSRNRVLYIKNVDNASKQSLNSLLKFIEEPVENTYIVMTSKNYLKVLPTIISRSQLLVDFQIKDDERSSTKEFSLLFKRLFVTKKIYDIQQKEELDNIVSDITKGLNQATSSSSDLYISLNKIINKDNFDIVLKMLLEFYNDIWRIEEGVPLSFEESIPVIITHKSISFDYKKCIELVLETLNKNKKILNFNLLKHSFIIRLGELYE